MVARAGSRRGAGAARRGVTVRAARAEDSATIARLDCRFFSYAGLLPGQVDYYRRKGPRHVLVAVEGRRVAGYLVGSLVRYGGAPALHVVSMGVVASRRRRGIGRRLLRAAVREARRSGAGRLRLEVWTANRPAVALYRSLGFEIRRRRRAYYEPGRDAFVMQRRLA